MDNDNNNEAIIRFRSENRYEISTMRKQNRESLHRRLRLCHSEIETLGGKISVEEFKELLQRLKQKFPPLETLKAIKNNCLTSSHREVFFKTAGAFDALVRILISKNAALQLEASACITNLACGSHKWSYRVAKISGPYLVSFINSSSYFLQDQCAWAVGNIANDCLDCFSLLKSQGVIPALLMCLKSSSTDVLRSTFFALSACTKYRSLDLKDLDYPGVVERIVKNIKDQIVSNDALVDATSTLSNIYCLVSMSNLNICLKEADFILTLLQREISNSSFVPNVILCLIRCLGYMTRSDEVCKYLSTEPKFRFTVKEIFQNKHQILKFESLWILSNISDYEESFSILDINVIFEVMDSTNNPENFLQVLYHVCSMGSKNRDLLKLVCSDEFILKYEQQLTLVDRTYNFSTETFLQALLRD